MHPRLGAQPAVGILAAEVQCRSLDAGDFTRARIQHFTIEAALRRPLDIHAHQHLRPILCFGAAGTCLDVEEGTARIHLAAEHPLEFDLADEFLDLRDVALDLGRSRGVVLRLREFEQLDRIAHCGCGSVDRFEFLRELGAFLAQLLRALGLRPDGGLFELAPYFLEAFFLVVVLKETP
jgi:hypothetical protein